MAGPDDAVGAVLHQVVREDEAEDRRAVGEGDAGRVVLNDGVVIDGDIARPARQREKVAVPAPAHAVDVEEHVVANRNHLGLFARMIVVAAENLDAGGGVPDDVVLKRHVIHLTPGAIAVLVPHREQHRVAGLVVLPVVLEEVPGNRHPARVLHLDQVLDRPVSIAPRGLLRKPVACNRDVGRHQVRHRRIGAAEHQVFAGRFEIVVGDGVGTGTVPAADRLRVLADRLDLVNVGAGDHRRRAVQRDAAFLPLVGIAVHVQAIDRQVVRDLRRRALRPGPISQHDDVAGAVDVGQDLEQHQPPVVRAGRGGNRGRSISRPDPGEQRIVRRRHPLAITRQTDIVGGADGDPIAARLARQHEISRKRRPRLQHDRVARVCAVDRLLQVAARRNRDGSRPRRGRRQQPHHDHNGTQRFTRAHVERGSKCHGEHREPAGGSVIGVWAGMPETD